MVLLTPTGQDLLFDEKRSRPASSSRTSSGTRPRLVHDAPRRRATRARCRTSQLRLTLADRWILSRYANAREGRDAQPQDLPLQRGRATRSTSSPGTSTATGTSRWPSRAGSRRARDAARRSARPRACGGVARARRHPAAAAPVHAVRDRGDLAARCRTTARSLAAAAWPKAKKAWFDAEAEEPGRVPAGAGGRGAQPARRDEPAARRKAGRRGGHAPTSRRAATLIESRSSSRRWRASTS